MRCNGVGRGARLPSRGAGTARAAWGAERVSRELFIVARGEDELYEYLKRHFAGEPDMEVILDRRVDERRQRAEPAARERRHQHERRRNTRADEDLRSLGFAVIVLD